jgi:hypothetical protein
LQVQGHEQGVAGGDAGDEGEEQSGAEHLVVEQLQVEQWGGESSLALDEQEACAGAEDDREHGERAEPVAGQLFEPVDGGEDGE